MNGTCPPQEQLRSLSLGVLSEEKSDELIVHLQACETCQEEMGTLERIEDTLVGEIRVASQEQIDEQPFADEKQMGVAAARALAALSQSTQSTNSQSVPQQIGEYEIVEPLGHGGMGQVYLARHTKLGREVAIKFIAQHRRWDHKMRARFDTEMRTIGRLSHPNIVAANDAREVDGTTVLVTEYIDGWDLGEIVKRTGPLSLSNAAAIVSKVCDALEYCQEQGLVHRDIKPSNIMIGRDGSVKLLDLGLAFVLAEDGGPEFTATGQAVGTADYVAPEQINHSRQIDARADIYALGCTLYKLLSGRAPFALPEFSTAFAKMNAHVSTVPNSLDAVVANIPNGVVALVAKMLEKSPDARPQSANEVRDVLRSFATGADLVELVRTTEASQKREFGIQNPAGENRETPLKTSPTAGWFSKVPWWPMVASAIAAMAFGIWLGITITIKKPNGSTAQIEIPEGSSAIVDEDGNVEIVLAGTGQKHRITKDKVDNRLRPAAPIVASSRGGDWYDFSTSISSDDFVYDRIEKGDLLDVYYKDANEVVPRFLFANREISAVAEPSNDLQHLILLLTESENKLATKQAGGKFLLRFHDENQKLIADTIKLDGVWKVIRMEMGGVKFANDDLDQALIFGQGRVGLVSGSGDVQISRLTVKPNQILEFELMDPTTRLKTTFRALYLFTDSGKLEVYMNEDGRFPASTVQANVFYRLSRVVEPNTQAQLTAFQLIQSTQTAASQLEFYLADPVTKKTLGEAIISSADLVEAGAGVATNEQPYVEILLTAAAGERLYHITKNNIGKRISIQIAGKEIYSSVIASAFGPSCRIHRFDSIKKAREIAKAIVPRMSLNGTPVDLLENSRSSQAKLRELALAMHNFYSNFDRFPAAAEKVGEHSVSWRVKILPYLGLEELYDMYRLNEPWDSGHNLALVELMPDVFRHPESPQDSTTTDYVAIVGDETILPSTKGLNFSDIKDGTSRTVMFVESKSEIPWTKPVDVPYDDQSLGKVKNFLDGVINVAIADGRSLELSRNRLTDKDWTEMVNRADGEVVDFEQFTTKKPQAQY